MRLRLPAGLKQRLNQNLKQKLEQSFHPSSRKRLDVLLAFTTGAFLLTAVFQNCGQFEVINFSSSDRSMYANTFAKDCATDSVYQACIFYKGPMYQPDGVVVPQAELDATPLDSLMTYAIDISGQDLDRIEGTGIEILSPVTPAAAEESATSPEPTGELVKSEILSDNRKLAKLMTWYWTKRTMEFVKSTASAGASSSTGSPGSEEAEGSAGAGGSAAIADIKPDLSTALLNFDLRILPSASMTGYSSENKAILLKHFDIGFPDAFDASVLVHLLGEAMIHHIVGDVMKAALGQSHVECGAHGSASFAENCCKSEAGCSKAIVSGLSDYLVTRVFTDHAGIGDTLARDESGHKICERSRNPKLSRELTSLQTYRQCESDGRPGEIYSMGSYYASIWFGVRERLRAQSPSAPSTPDVPNTPNTPASPDSPSAANPESSPTPSFDERDFDRFFIRSLSLVEGSDTFESFQAKLAALDQSEFEGKFMRYFEIEASVRGVMIDQGGETFSAK